MDTDHRHNHATRGNAILPASGGVGTRRATAMKRIPAGQFKQTCLRLLDEVRATGERIVVTKRGVAVAQLVPLDRDDQRDWRGAMVGTGRILGDLVAPAAGPGDWEALGS